MVMEISQGSVLLPCWQFEKQTAGNKHDKNTNELFMYDLKIFNK
jgi:hypothetical protein